MDTKELELTQTEGAFIKYICTLAETKTMEEVVMAFWMKMAGEEGMNMRDIFRVLVKLAVTKSAPKISITEEQLIAMFNIVGFRDFRVIGNAEVRGRKSNMERLTWERIAEMSDEERAMLSGSAVPRKPKD